MVSEPQTSRSNDKLITPQDQAVGRLVPASIEAEACVLGAMILDSTAIDIVVQILKGEHFHRPAHKTIYDTLTLMREESKPIDLVTLKAELERSKQLENIGGVEYMVALAEGVPGISNVEYYANIVLDKAMLRGLIRISRTIIDEAYDSPEEAKILIDRAEKSVFDLTQDRVGDLAVGLRDLIQQTFKNMEETAGQPVTGISTGYPKLDEMTSGFHGEEMIILAARPSMGKTALLLNLAEYMAVVDRKPIAFFSLEMSRLQITQRLLASYAQFNLRDLRRTAISPQSWTNLQNAADKLNDAPFLIDDSPTLTPLQLRAKARRMKSQYDIQCIFIDYLQLMTPSMSNSQTKRHEAIGDMSRSLKALARELDIPVVAAAQLNRGPADRPTHTPRMSDLRESGSIEQDADVVMLLHNEDYYHRGEPDYIPENKTHLIIEKQRNGPTGVVHLVFRPECTRFEQAAPDFVG